MVGRLEQLIFGHRTLILALFALGTLLLGAIAARGLRIDTSFNKTLPLQHEYMRTYLDPKVAEFRGANRVLVALIARDGNMFTPEFFAALRKATDEVTVMDGIDRTRVQSLFTPNVRYIEVVEDGIEAGNVVAADFTPTPENLARVRDNIRKAGILGRLVANDFSGALVSATVLDQDAQGKRVDPIQIAHQLEQRVQQVIEHPAGVDVQARASSGIETATLARHGIDVRMIGFAKVMGDIADGADFGGDVRRHHAGADAARGAHLLPVVARRLRAGAVLGDRGDLAARRAGAAALRHRSHRPAGAVSDIRHRRQPRRAEDHRGERCGARRTRQHGSRTPHFPAAAGAGGDRAAGGPGRLRHHPPHPGAGHPRDGDHRLHRRRGCDPHGSGAAAGAGVLRALRRRLPRAGASGGRRSWRRCGAHLSGVTRRGPALAIIAVVRAARRQSAGGSGRKTPIGDTQAGVPELRADSRYNRDNDVITSKFSIGVDVLTAIVESKEPVCVSHDLMSGIDRFGWHMRNVPGVQDVITLPFIAKVAIAGWNEGSLKWRSIPREQTQLTQSTRYIETSTGLLNENCDVVPVLMFLTDHRAETIERVVAAVKAWRAANPLPGAQVRLAAGNVGVMAATNETVEAKQMLILAGVFGAVIVMCLITFRSLVGTLLVVVPLALVSVLVYAVMYLLGIGLKVSTLPMVALGAGIGVDYGIYLFSRMQEFLHQGLSVRESYERTLRVTGASIIFTGITLAIGVATWVFSPLKFQADIGIMLTFMFLVNMLAAIILLPALAAWLLHPDGLNVAPAPCRRRAGRRPSAGF